jgi:NAD(P)-dependent dehydrogenase (short-subunit alcohol dehydrogenase family)
MLICVCTTHQTLGVNLFGVINGSNAFTKSLVDGDEPGLIIVTGSKQGITNPPTGNPSYNVSKAGVKGALGPEL